MLLANGGSVVANLAPWVAIMVTLLLAGAAAMWKLASTLSALQANVNREFTHNGGSTLKDHAKGAKENAEQALIVSEVANERVGRVEDAVAALSETMKEGQRRATHNEGEVQSTLRWITDHIEAINRDRLVQAQAWYAWALPLRPDAPPPLPAVPPPPPAPEIEKPK